jgi:putative transposase
VLDDLLTRAQVGPMSKLSDRVAARTRVAGATHRPPPRDDARPAEPGKPTDDDEDGPLATVIPFGIFDADAEAER